MCTGSVLGRHRGSGLVMFVIPRIGIKNLYFKSRYEEIRYRMGNMRFPFIRFAKHGHTWRHFCSNFRHPLQQASSAKLKREILRPSYPSFVRLWLKVTSEGGVGNQPEVTPTQGTKQDSLEATTINKPPKSISSPIPRIPTVGSLCKGRTGKIYPPIGSTWRARSITRCVGRPPYLYLRDALLQEAKMNSAAVRL